MNLPRMIQIAMQQFQYGKKWQKLTLWQYNLYISQVTYHKKRSKRAEVKMAGVSLTCIGNMSNITNTTKYDLSMILNALNNCVIKQESNHDDQYASGDATWILTSAFIIFTMQSGFGLLEAGKGCIYYLSR